MGKKGGGGAHRCRNNETELTPAGGKKGGGGGKKRGPKSKFNSRSHYGDEPVFSKGLNKRKVADEEAGKVQSEAVAAVSTLSIVPIAEASHRPSLWPKKITINLRLVCLNMIDF